MYKIVVQSKFKKDAKKFKNNKKKQDLILETIKLLQIGDPLPKEYQEHKLIGDYIGYSECHTSPDLLIIFSREDEKKEIRLYRVGNHADLFG